MLTSRIRVGVAACAAATLSLVAACGQSAAPAEPSAAASATESTLVFAAVPAEASTSLQQDYETVIALLEQETGMTVEFQNATSYAAVIEGMRAGQIDIAQLGPFSYVLATGTGAEITPVGATVEEPGAEPGYKSYGIVPAGSPITDLAGFAGKTVCFVDPGSTSGYLYPTAALLELGIDPAAGDVEPVFAGGHDASALAVASGQCDAGFAYDDMVDTQLIESGQLEPGAVEVVWRSETIPGSPLAISDALPEEVKQTLTTAIQEKANVDYLTANGICDSVETCVVGEEGGWGYVPVDDALYDSVRKVCEISQAESCTVL